MGLTSRLAQWTVNTGFSRIPAKVVEKSKQMLLNSAAVGLAMAGENEVDIVSRYVEDIGGKAQSTVLGRGMRTSASYAALVNAVMMDLPDYEGAVRRRGCSSSRVVAPAVMAVAEQLGASGKELIEAYTVGCEIATKVAAAGDLDDPIMPRMAAYGWHLASVAGTIGAAAGAGKLLDLTAEQMKDALAIAVSQASGVTVSFGKPTLACQMGFAAMKGVIAATLARRGIRGASNGLEAPNGFYGCYRRDNNIDEKEFFERLANPYDVINPGMLLKFYPCGSQCGTPIEAALHLVQQHQLTAAHVRAVHASVPEQRPGTTFTRPQTALQARKSIDYGVAVALVHGIPRIQHYTDAAMRDPHVKAMMQKVTWDETEQATVDVPTPCTLTITLDDGQVLRHRVEYEKGHPGNPLTAEELDQKFTDCSRGRLSAQQIETAIDHFHHLEQMADVAPFFSMLGGNLS